MKHWEHFSHEADMGIRGIGATCAEAFEQAALGLTAMVTDLEGVKPLVHVELFCDAPDNDLLLVDWLNTIICEMATRHLVFSSYEVRLTNGHLDGSAWGEKIDPLRHHPVVEPKGATYTCLTVHREGEIWVAQCVVDV
ncbi:MAG TPA: archease [Burkholderiales bacterium]|nr:archease [Pseudomonadota bacterium]HVC49204.1 archease [Burkholderiales bacterium]